MNVSIDITDVVLKTERLVLRAWNESDLEDFYEYASVDGVGQMAGWYPHRDINDSRMILNMFISEKRTFAIVYQGKVIGSLGLDTYDEKEFNEFGDLKGIEIGFVLSKDYWGMGLMPEAVNAVIPHLFDEAGVYFILCSHALTNLQSKRVQEKCGFKPYRQYVRRLSIGSREAQMNILWKKA